MGNLDLRDFLQNFLKPSSTTELFSPDVVDFHILIFFKLQAFSEVLKCWLANGNFVTYSLYQNPDSILFEF